LTLNSVQNTKSKDKNELSFTYVFIEGNGKKLVKESKTLPYVTKWKIALDDEYESLFKNKRWTLDDLPPNRTSISCNAFFERNVILIVQY